MTDIGSQQRQAMNLGGGRYRNIFIAGIEGTSKIEQASGFCRTRKIEWKNSVTIDAFHQTPPILHQLYLSNGIDPLQFGQSRIDLGGSDGGEKQSSVRQSYPR